MMTTTSTITPSTSPVRRGTPPRPRQSPRTAVRDVRTMVVRETRRQLHSVDGLVTALVLPVAIMLVFVVIFGGAISDGGSYIDYVVPGVLVMCLGFGSATAAVAVAQDMTSGTMDRFKTLPIFGPSPLWGHVLASVMRNLVSATAVVGVAVALGFRPGIDPAGWAGVVAFAVLAVLAFTWLSAALGLVLSVEASQSVNMLFLFVPYLSSGFVAVATMPTWLHGFANNQPSHRSSRRCVDCSPGPPTARRSAPRSRGWRACSWSAVRAAPCSTGGALHADRGPVRRRPPHGREGSGMMGP